MDSKVENNNTCIISGEGKFIAKKGTVMGYKGKFDFSKSNLSDIMTTKECYSFIGDKIKTSTKNNDYINIEGEGSIYLSNNSNSLNIIDLDNEEIYIAHNNLLAFSSNLKYNVEVIGAGELSISGKIMNHLKGTGFVIIEAISPIITMTPFIANLDNIISWTGLEKPIIKKESSQDMFYNNPTYMLNFFEKNKQIVIQPFHTV